MLPLRPKVITIARVPYDSGGTQRGRHSIVLITAQISLLYESRQDDVRWNQVANAKKFCHYTFRALECIQKALFTNKQPIGSQKKDTNNANEWMILFVVLASG